MQNNPLIIINYYQIHTLSSYIKMNNMTGLSLSSFQIINQNVEKWFFLSYQCSQKKKVICKVYQLYRYMYLLVMQGKCGFCCQILIANAKQTWWIPAWCISIEIYCKMKPTNALVLLALASLGSSPVSIHVKLTRQEDCSGWSYFLVGTQYVVVLLCCSPLKACSCSVCVKNNLCCNRWKFRLVGLLLLSILQIEIESHHEKTIGAQ